MNNNLRITNPEASIAETVYGLTGGNPGAIRVCAELLKIDPAYLFCLDAIGVHDSAIWMLYKDGCDEDIKKAAAVLDAWQMGTIPGNTILERINSGANYRHMFDDVLLADAK